MKLGQHSLVHFLDKFDQTPFLVEAGSEEYLVGQGKPAFKVYLNKELDARELLASTSLALGEAYMRGDIEIEGDLYDALSHFLAQMESFSTDRRKMRALISTSLAKKNQSREVSSHYDIGNDFYSLWLDDTLSYSCGYFANESDTLHDAQVNKVDRILEKLCLKEGMTLLDVGCGWGYLLMRAAKRYHVKGVGITLSKEQYHACNEKIAREGMSNYLTVELMDYRDLKQYGRTFDRVVSVGMLEHVGRKNYPLFLSTIQSVLNPGGLLLLHYISALKEFPGDPWIKKYIFPGGVVPSLREIINISADCRFYVLDVESLRRHYNKTLLCWDHNFNEHRAEIEEKMGVEFARMWDLYLCSCAATFQNGIIDLHQILMSNGVNNELPSTRWY